MLITLVKKRKQKSTGTTDRRLALQLAVEWERAALTAKRGAMTEAQIRKVMGELLEQATGELLHFASVRDFFERWIRIKEGAKSEKTTVKYEWERDSFLAKPERPFPVSAYADCADNTNDRPRPPPQNPEHHPR